MGEVEKSIVRSERKARLVVLELAHIMSVPMSLIAVLKFKVPEAILQAGNAPLSAAEILARIRPHGGADADNLQRLLRLLASYDIFEEHLTSCGGQRKYSLTDVGKSLADDDQGLSYAYFMLQHHQDAMMRAWPMVGEAVEDTTVEPFEKVNGEAPIDYYSKRQDEVSLFYKSLSGMCVPFMNEMLQVYDGFQGVETLVDVAGNNGITLRMIMEKCPNIRKGINYDLPGMVAAAPEIPGVTHVGGDAFESIPSGGDAIFVKWSFLTWTDEEAKLVFENSYKALPEKGKMIVCEPVLPELTDESRRTRALLSADIFIMTMYRTKGKHRTEQQFKQLGISSGFSHFRAFYFDSYLTVLEFHK